MICLLVMTDGRESVHEAVASAECMVVGPVTQLVIHDDTGEADHRADLAARYPAATVIGGDRAGFGGAIQRAWAHIRSLQARFVFHLEDDFTFNRTVDLAAMADVLAARPHLQQLALRRQPWNDDERAAGGVVEQHPEAYTEITAGPNVWLEHRRFFTTNPCLYRRTLTERAWPDGRHSEGRFGLELFAEHPENVAGFWGSRDSGEWVTHIGHDRVGVGY